jgi:hypothetical protein
MKTLDWLEETFYKFYSKSAEGTKYWWVSYLTAGIFALPFTGGLLGTVIGWVDMVRVSSWVFMIMFLPFCFLWLVVAIYHNWKLKNLKKGWK